MDASARPLPFCSKHDRLLEYFCTDDEEAICSRCYIMGDHKDHAIQSFEEKNKLLVASLENGIETATVVYNKLSKLDKTSVTNKLKVDKAKLMDNVVRSFAHMHDALKHREGEILNEIDSIFKDRISAVNGLVENAKNDKQKLEKALGDSRSLLENPSIMVDGDGLLTAISSAPQTPCILSENISHTTWDDTPMGDIIEAVRVFGILKDKEEIISLKTVEEAPETIEDDDKIFRFPIATQKSCDAQSISSIDTGEDVIIESDTDSITTSVSSISNRSSNSKEIVVPQIKGQCKQGIVTHIRSPNDFYVQLLMNKNTLEKMSQNMNAWCRKKSSAKSVPNVVERGMLVLACYSEDNQWYRARILDVDVSPGTGDCAMKAHVMYFDFGNEEKLPLKSLRKMEPRFSRYPPFCFHCSLYDITPFYNQGGEWENNAIQEFFRLTRNQVLLLNAIAMKGLTYEVDLICTPAEDVLDDQFTSVRDMLIFLELGKFARPNQSSGTAGNKSASYKVHKYFKPTPLANGETTEVIVSEAHSPSNFYIMRGGEENLYYLNMMEEMKDVYANDVSRLYMMHCPRKDALCAVKGPDNKWHRGKIVSDPKHSKVTVFLTDTGSTLVVHYDKIKKLLSDFIKLPSQAVHCKLADVDYTDPALGDWSEEAKVWCRSDLKGAQGLARVVRWGELTDVVLWMDFSTSGPSVNSLLVEAKLAVGKGPASMPVVKTKNQALLPSPNMAATKGKKNSSGNEMSRNTRNPSRAGNSSTNVVTNSQCSSSAASPSKRDGAQLYKPPSSIKPTSPSFNVAASPSKSLPSSTQGVNLKPSTSTVKISAEANSTKPESKSKKDQKSKDKKRSKRYRELARPEEDDEAGGKNGKDFASAAETARKKKVQEDIHKAVGGGGDTGEGGSDSKAEGESIYIEIIVSFYQSPTNFYIRIQEQEGALQSLMQELSQEYKDSEVVAEQKWSAEDFCVVRYPVDKNWYRAKINSVLSSADVEVELLDYGDTFSVSQDELRPLHRDLGTRLRRAAVRCHLAGLIPTGSSDRNKWSKTATEFMENVIKNKKLYIKTEGDPCDLGLPIDIIIEEEIPETAFDPVTFTYHSLRQKMVDEGLAMFDKPRKRATVSITSKTEKEDNSSEKESHSQESASTDSAMIPPGEVELPPYEIPDLNAEIEVIPTFVDFSGVIYAQRADWDAKITHLSEELQRVYKDSPPCCRQWSLGDVCVAFFTDDGLWYRGLVEEMDGNKVKVFYVDFGNSAWVTFDLLREIQGPFVADHIQVYHCVLEDLIPNTVDGLWPVALLDIVHEMVVNCLCTMVYTGMMDNGHLKIRLSKPDGFDLSSYLMDNGYAVSTMNIKERYAHSKAIGAILTSSGLYSHPDISGAGTVFHALATEVELPNVVYVQRMRLEEADVHDFVRSSEIAAINNEIREFEQMMETIKTTPSSGFINLPDPGMLCLAKYHFDNSWYRALCVEKIPETDSCLVIFIDYGTSELVSKDWLRSLPSQFWDLPCQGIRCHLNLTPPGGPTCVWRKNSLDAMVAALNQRTLMVKVVQASPLMVELFVESESGEMSLAYEELIQKGLAWLPMQISADMLMLGGDDANANAMTRGSDDVEVEEVIEGGEDEEVAAVEVEDVRSENINVNMNDSCDDEGDVVVEEIGEEETAMTMTRNDNEDITSVKESVAECASMVKEKVNDAGVSGEGVGKEEDVLDTSGDGGDGEDGWSTASDDEDEGSAV